MSSGRRKWSQIEKHNCREEQRTPEMANMWMSINKYCLQQQQQ